MGLTLRHADLAGDRKGRPVPRLRVSICWEKWMGWEANTVPVLFQYPSCLLLCIMVGGSDGGGG